MFKLFTFKQLCFISLTVCIIMLLGAFLNVIAPVVSASQNTGITVSIIMYHHICNKEKLWCDYVISADLLKSDFEYLKNNGIKVISFKELENYIKTGRGLPQNCAILTFDDGHKSFITKAVPLLTEYNYPANVNIVGSLTQLYTESGETSDTYAYLNQEDIKRLYGNPLIELGCHTFNFHSLNNRRGMGKLKNESTADYERTVLLDLKKFNELFYNITGNKTKIFAYPFGIRNDHLLNILREQGFSVTLTCRESINIIRKGSSLYELGRFNRPYGVSSECFFEKIF